MSGVGKGWVGKCRDTVHKEPFISNLGLDCSVSPFLKIIGGVYMLIWCTEFII